MPHIHDPDAPVPNWTPPPRPGPDVLKGRYARLERLDPARHCDELFAANAGADAMWDYMFIGPFADQAAYRAWADGAAGQPDPYYYAIHSADAGCFCGVASFMRINPEAGSIEVGSIALAPVLQRTRAATEAMVLMIRWAFEAGYRRFEWKCNASNTPSRRAAQRLGLSFEGVFRQALVAKGRNRDTAWFAAIDGELPALSAAYEAWLDSENFDVQGCQRRSLRELTDPILVSRDPSLD